MLGYSTHWLGEDKNDKTIFKLINFILSMFTLIYGTILTLLNEKKMHTLQPTVTKYDQNKTLIIKVPDKKSSL